MIGTLIQPTTGSVDYGSLGATSQAVRSRLGWLGHETLCYPDLTGRENVELSARLAGVDAAVAWKKAADRFAFGPVASRPVRTMSRGQRQRFALARALTNQPQLLLLDEPSTGLDVEGVDRLVSVLEAETARGVSVLVVTHDVKLSDRLNAKTFQMDRGRLKERA